MKMFVIQGLSERKHHWSLGYFFSIIGLYEKAIIQYIRWQNIQDLGHKINLKPFNPKG